MITTIREYIDARCKFAPDGQPLPGTGMVAVQTDAPAWAELLAVWGGFSLRAFRTDGSRWDVRVTTTEILIARDEVSCFFQWRCT